MYVLSLPYFVASEGSCEPITVQGREIFQKVGKTRYRKPSSEYPKATAT
jgi:hypothetical protein